MQPLRRTLHPEVEILDSRQGLCAYIASDESIDNFSEIIRATGWRFSHFAKNAPFVDSHDYASIEKCVGKVVDFEVRHGRLVETVQWAADIAENKLAPARLENDRGRLPQGRQRRLPPHQILDAQLRRRLARGASLPRPGPRRPRPRHLHRAGATRAIRLHRWRQPQRHRLRLPRRRPPRRRSRPLAPAPPRPRNHHRHRLLPSLPSEGRAPRDPRPHLPRNHPRRPRQTPLLERRRPPSHAPGSSPFRRRLDQSPHPRPQHLRRLPAPHRHGPGRL